MLTNNIEKGNNGSRSDVSNTSFWAVAEKVVNNILKVVVLGFFFHFVVAIIFILIACAFMFYFFSLHGRKAGF